MDFPFWFIVFLPLLIVLIEEHERQRAEKQKRVLQVIKTRKSKGTAAMSEIISKFIGKECLITTMSATVDGVIESVDGNWISVCTKAGATENHELVNIDYISRIREYPKNKNGKKKLVVG